MAKSFLYKIFGSGKMPEDLKNDLQYFEEGIPTTVTYRGYRAPWKYFALKKKWFSGALGSSKKSIVAIIGKRVFIHVPFDDERYKKLKISRKENQIIIRFNSNDFDKKTSGEIEVKFTVASPENFQKLIS